MFFHILVNTYREWSPDQDLESFNESFKTILSCTLIRPRPLASLKTSTPPVIDIAMLPTLTADRREAHGEANLILARRFWFTLYL